MEEFLELVKKGFFWKKWYDSRQDHLLNAADMLEREDLVKRGFKKILVDREDNYLTEVQIMTVPVSTPHAEFPYVNRGPIVVTVLEKPVLFRRVDAPEEEVGAEISLMLLLRDVYSHLTVLQQLSGLFQSDKLAHIRETDSMERLAQILQEE